MTDKRAIIQRVPFRSRLPNPIIERLLLLGVPIPPMILLTVRGRTTGQPRTTPVGLFEHAGHRYVFSTFGEVNWVRNLRAAGEAVLTRRHRHEAISAVELTPEAAGPILQRFLAPYLRSPIFGRVLRPHFPVAPDASVNDFINEARRHPVFDVQAKSEPGRPTPPSPARNGGFKMNPDDFPTPNGGVVLTHFLVVSDQDRSRDFYRSLLGGQVLLERDPVIMKVANTWLILNVGGGPTDDKPTVTLTTPPDPNRTSAFLNIRVADIDRVYKEWSAKGVEFLTEPKDHGREIRAYIRDPDGHLIEVGQTTGTRS